MHAIVKNTDLWLGGHWTARACDSYLGKLPMATEGFRRSADQLEEAFLRVVEAVEAISEKTRTVEYDSSKVVSMISGEDGGTAIDEALGLVLESIETIQGKGSEFGELVERMKQQCDHIDEILKMREQIEQVVAPFVYVRTLVRVEAVHLPNDYRVVFESLAGDMDKLIEEVRLALEEQFLSLERTKTEMRASLDSLEQRVEEGNQRVASMHGHVEGNMGVLRAIVDGCKGRNSRLEQASSDMVRGVGELVIGLQFHDIVSQRFDHIGTGFDQMMGDGKRCWCLMENDHNSYLHASSMLQAAQLEGVESELKKAEEEIGSGLEFVEKCNGQLKREVVEATDCESHTMTAGGFVDVMQEQIHAIESLLEIYSELEEEAVSIVKPLGETTSDMTTSLTSITMGIRLIALNAQVHAAQLESESGLDALAQQTRETSDEMLGLTEALGQELAELQRGFRGNMDKIQRLVGQTESDRSRLHGEGVKAMEKLHEMRDGMIQMMLGVAQTADEVEGLIEDVRKDVKFAECFESPIGAAKKVLWKIQIETMQIHSRTKLSTESLAKIEALQSNYTMAGERQIHLTTTGMIHTTEGVPVLEEVEVLGGEAEDPLEGFDLFEENDDSVKSLESSIITDCDLKGDPAGCLQDDVKSSGHAKSDLGDNVDLF